MKYILHNLNGKCLLLHLLHFHKNKYDLSKFRNPLDFYITFDTSNENSYNNVGIIAYIHEKDTERIIWKIVLGSDDKNTTMNHQIEIIEGHDQGSYFLFKAIQKAGAEVLNSREDYRMGYLWQSDELICYDVINPTQYVFHEDTETFTLVYTKYNENYEIFYNNTLNDVEEAKETREYMLDMVNHPNWFDASFIPWLSYDALNIELPDGNLYFTPIINWGKYREENNRIVMPVSVRLNHAIADGYLVAKIFRLLEQEIKSFVMQ